MEKATDLNLCDSHTLDGCAVPDGLPLKQHLLLSLASWKWCLRWWLEPFWRIARFSWVSLMYAGCTHLIKLLLVFLLLIYLWLQGVLSQQSIRVDGKLYFLFQLSPDVPVDPSSMPFSGSGALPEGKVHHSGSWIWNCWPWSQLMSSGKVFQGPHRIDTFP